MKTKILTTTSILLFGVAVSASSLRADDRTIGYILPLTGDAAYFGTEARRGVELALDELPDKPKVVFEDERCLPKDGVTAWQKLTKADNAAIIIGPACTGSIKAVAPLAKSSKRPLVALWDAGGEIEGLGEQIYAVGFDTEEEAVVAARLMAEQGLKKVALLWEEDSFAVLVKDVFKREIAKRGGSIVAGDSVPAGAQDLRTLLGRLLASSPDAFFIAPAYSAATAVQQLRALGWKGAIYGPDTFGFPGVIEAGGAAMEGVRYANVELSESTPALKHFSEQYRRKYGTSPASLAFAAFGYESFRLAASLPIEKEAQTKALPLTVFSGLLPLTGFSQGRMQRLVPTMFVVEGGKPKRLPQ